MSNTMKMADGTPIAERWAGMYELCAGAKVGNKAVILNLIEDVSRAEERERVLRDALEHLLRHAEERLTEFEIDEGWAALATPAPQQHAQPSAEKEPQ